MNRKASTKLLNTEQTAAFLCLSRNTLNQWRYLKRGPKFHKIGKCVRYSEADLLEYLESQSRVRTSRRNLQTY